MMCLFGLPLLGVNKIVEAAIPKKGVHRENFESIGVNLKVFTAK